MTDQSQDVGSKPDAGRTQPLDAAARAALLAAIEWQIEAGVDECVGDLPVNRMTATQEMLSAGGAAADTNSRIKAPAAGGGKGRPAAEDGEAPRDIEAQTQDARHAAEEAQDLAALKAALEAFEGSTLKTGAKNCVFADGDPAADLMVIGEGPGKDEDRIGKPFVGRSGQLLDRMLAAIGLDRAAKAPKQGVYIANLVPWRPLGNRTPDDQEVTVLLPFLERHIALAQPKLILCVGAPAAKHVMGAKTGITKFRGSWIDYDRTGAAIPCLSTLHPAYLLRSPEMKRFAWRDLLSLRARLDLLQESDPQEKDT